MRDFIKTTAAVICGMLIVSVLCLVLSISVFGALMTAGNSVPTLPKSGVLVIDMSKIVIEEQSNPGNMVSALGGDNKKPTSVSLWDALSAINTAAMDPSVQYILLRTDGSSTSLATTEEIRTALDRFRWTSGKAVISYIESPTTYNYYLASVADKVYMTAHPGSMIQFNGVSAQMTFFGDLLKKFGVNMQLIRAGKYKSAGEVYTRSNPTPENREQYQRIVDSFWETLSVEIAKSRGISVERLNEMMENLELCHPQDFLECGLVDELFSLEELKDKLATLAVVESFKDVELIAFNDYILAKNNLLPKKASKEIAVIYANGNIIEGSSTSDVAGDRFADIIANVRADSTVKAVVLRVNSPGGSVLASEKIKSELDLLRKDKPLITSYGSYAASGGYWISTASDRIFSNASTLTGSIGVFALVPDFSKTTKDVLKINVELINSHKHSDIYSGLKTFDKDENAYMEGMIDTIYTRFLSIVSSARNMTVEQVDELAQGRVWVGADAYGLGLVDELGGLEDAVLYAAVTTGDPELMNWRIGSYPRPQTQWEKLMEMFNASASGSLIGELGLLKNNYEILYDGVSTLMESLQNNLEPRILARMDTEVHIR